MTTIELSATDAAAADDFAGTLFMAALGAMELANIELGIRLGLYEALADGPATSASIAKRTGTVERYVREWLEQQAVAGVVTVDGASKPVDERTFGLPVAHAHVLLDEDSLACMRPAVGLAPWLGKALDIMAGEFRTGAGVAFGDFDIHELQAAFNRPTFAHHLVQSWLPALPEVQDRLSSGAAVRIAEVGCGAGGAALTIAEAYPNVRVDGYDLDQASIRVAQAAAAERGLDGRVRFECRDAGDPTLEGAYDLVMAVEMIHDMPEPVAVLRAMRTLAAPAGAVLVVDERTLDAFSVPADETERFLYTFSVLHCLAVSMQGGGVGTGTMMRADTLREYASSAGFSSVEVLDVEHPQFRLYRLH